MSKPEINVTPLIDVLLVLLIIFMVVTPLKPSAFEARVPQEPKQEADEPNPLTLIVTVRPDSTLRLNGNDAEASVTEPEALIRTLSSIFAERQKNQVFAQSADGVTDRIEKRVFIKAPRGLNYGSVAKVVDAVKISGADPVSLQLDRLD